MMKARFFTKFAAPGEDYTAHNGEIVDIIGKKAYLSGFKDVRYIILFKDGTIARNILSTELDFDI